MGEIKFSHYFYSIFYMEYVIKEGQTLSEISNLFNIPIKDLCLINNISNPNVIKVGQILILSDLLGKDNIKEKIDKFINFIESKKIKRTLSSVAKESIELIFHKCLEFDVTDLRMVSYILATTHWETCAYGQKFIYEPISEQGKGKGLSYGIPHKKTGKTYYGRGFVQITWFDNYERFTKLLYSIKINADLVNKPELALNPEIASIILVLGMKTGKFTGSDLFDYFSASKSDYYNARRIVNGLDKAVIIADIAKEIHYIIK